ncbi:AraC family transcriptional regulator [Paenibacillus sp. MMO-58]|uniref:AraC family transcriptional regulator n=1 Tax=Paenibacillus sp. MMO-58 TaxID=3081290 RepID=UPI0030186AB0
MTWQTNRDGEVPEVIHEIILESFRLAFQLLGTHWRTVGKGWSYKEHQHPLLELNIVLQGSQSTVISGKEYIQRAGDLLLIRPDEVHHSRNASDEPMTYFSMHLDVDDPDLFCLLSRIEQHLFRAESRAVQQLMPHIEELMEICSAEPENDPVRRLDIRVKVMQILLILTMEARNLTEPHTGIAGRPQGESSVPLLRHREQSSLEKKVQTLFSEPYMREVQRDEATLPSFRWAGVFTFQMEDKPFWQSTDRFWMKEQLTEDMKELGTVVVVDDPPFMNAAVLTLRHAVPNMEEIVLKKKRELEERLGITIKLGFGGITAAVSELRSLYLNSLRQLGHSEETDGKLLRYEFVSRIIRSAMKIMEAEYGDKGLSLVSLAKRLGVTPNYLSNQFSSQTGATFTHHLTSIRIHQAIRLMRETNLKIYQVGELVGYADHAYFSRLFKLTVGVSPAKYRLSEQSF